MMSIQVNATGELRRKCFNEVVPASPNLRFLFLTKRPSNIPAYIPRHWQSGAPSNVMFGTSVGTQATADQATPQLRKAPGQRFLSIEPLLEAVKLNLDGINWVIVGTESGAGRRPMQAEWARDIKRQCDDSGVAFFCKQMEVGGKVVHSLEQFPGDLRVRQMPEVAP